MGALDMELTGEELHPLVDAWKQSNPNIVKFWWDVDHAVMEAIKFKHTSFSCPSRKEKPDISISNNRLVPQYYVEGNHEAIIPKDIYLQVQEESVRRRVVKTSANSKKCSYSFNHCFSQIVICGECGEMFRRLHWNNRGIKSII